MTNDPTLSASLTRRKAYSYLRFSTPEQSKGDSYRRQMSMAAAYAQEHNLELDQELTFHDVGVSAYRGQNADAGRLAYFLEAVTSGHVPQGSLLLVEQLDRISRLTPLRALDVLRNITSAGVAVVTLNDGKVYTSESLEGLPMDLIISILTFTRANEESATKSRRLKAAWEAKRANVDKGVPLTRKAPAWLQLSEDGQAFEILPERADLVGRIFQMALDGVGQHKIASTFNSEGIAPWGRGKFWHRSYIAKVLSNPAVIGVFQPHVIEYDGTTKQRKALEPVEGYFPAIIAPDTFREAQALRQAKGAPQRGRHAHAPITNILAGLAVCSKCGATMTRVVKGKRSQPSYVCTRAKGGAGCEYKSVHCDRIEAALLQGLPERLRELDGTRGKVTGLDDEVEAARGRVGHLEDRIEVLLDNLSYERSPALVDRLGALADDLEAAKEALRGLQERQEAATGLTVAARIERTLAALQPPTGEPSMGDINHRLRTVFKQAVIDADAGTIDLEWTHGGTCTLHFPTFTKQPGPGWRWKQQEELHED